MHCLQKATHYEVDVIVNKVKGELIIVSRYHTSAKCVRSVEGHLVLIGHNLGHVE